MKKPIIFFVQNVVLQTHAIFIDGLMQDGMKIIKKKNLFRPLKSNMRLLQDTIAIKRA